MTESIKYGIKIELKINDRNNFFMDDLSQSIEKSVMDVAIYDSDILLESGDTHRHTGRKIANELKRIKVHSAIMINANDDKNIIRDNASFINTAITETIWELEMDGIEPSEFPHTVVDGKIATIVISKFDITSKD